MIVRLIFWSAVVMLPGALTAWSLALAWRRLGGRFRKKLH